MCTVNAWILYKDLKQENKDVSYLTFLINLAEELAEEGVKLSNLPMPKKGPPKKRKTSALHLPIGGNTRRRCIRCSTNQVQKRTKTICKECNVVLCKL